jgi:hypothetical protein
MNTETSSPRVRIISQREGDPAVSPGAPLLPPLREMAAPPLNRSSPEFLQGMATLLATMAKVVAVRSMLLLALLGGFVLAALTIAEPSILKLVGNALFDILVFIPLVYLYRSD